MAIKFAALFSLLFLLQPSAQAVLLEGQPSLIRQPTTMAMGGASIGLADTEYALFNNPAGLAGQEDRKFHVIGLGLEASGDTYTAFKTSVDAFKHFSTDSLNQLMGMDIALRGDAMTLVQLPHFAIAYIVDGQGSIEQFDPANPTFKVGDMITHGVQAGMGWSFSEGKHATDEFRVGVAGKALWRKGGFYNVSTTGFLSATANGKAFIDNLIGDYGAGFGADAGFQYVNHLDQVTQVSVGASITDIANTKFSSPQAEAIPMNIGFGLGFKRDLDFFKLKFDVDLQNLNQEGSLATKFHVGADVGIPLFDFYAGLNQLYPTLGVSCDIWILKVTATTYAEELGMYYNQAPSRRYMIQVDFYLPI